jgi:2-(1,2-epoxy-1,2-dihydrophenyl)acetyl-CoA isomerase
MTSRASADSTDDIEVEYRDGVAVVWFNRPEVLNAFRLAMFARLAELLEELAEAPGATALVLTGRGRAFCAGEDLAEMNEVAGTGFGLGAALTDLTRLQALTSRIADYPKPIVAAINGPAVGLGAELPLAADLRIASPAAYFFYPEARRGMLETNGTFRLLPEIVGLGRAAEWLLSARKVPAAEARAAGLLSELVAGDRLVDRAVALARQAAGVGEPA